MLQFRNMKKLTPKVPFATEEESDKTWFIFLVPRIMFMKKQICLYNQWISLLGSEFKNNNTKINLRKNMFLEIFQIYSRIYIRYL